MPTQIKKEQILEPILTKSETSVNNQPTFTVIDKFNTLQTNFYGNGTVTLDTTWQAEWTGCMRLTLSTAWVTWPRLALTSAANFFRKSFTIKCKASDWAQISTAEIMFATEAGFTNYYLWQWKWASNPKLVTPTTYNGEWVERVFSPGDCMVWSGTPNWWAITHIIIRGQSSSGTPTLDIDDFKYFWNTQKPMVCVTFDDSLSTQFSNGKAKLDQHDIKATFYSIWDLIGTGGYLTLSEAQTLSSQGHDIAGHGQTNLTTLTQAQRLTDLRWMKKWLVSNGFRGSNHYALPNGASNNAVLGDVQNYFNSIANIDWLSNTPEYSPQYMINRFSPDSSTSTATIQAWIDNVISYGGMAIIAWHGIVASGATGAQVNQSTYDTIMDYIGSKKQAWDIDTGTLTDYYARPIFWMKKELRSMPWYMSSEWKLTALQDALFQCEASIWQPPWAGSTTVPWIFGYPAFTIVGTPTARAYAVTNFFTRRKRIGYVSAATAGALTWPREAQPCMAVSNGAGLGWFFNVIRFWCSDAATVSGARQFVGISSTTTALTNVEPSTLLNCVWVGHGTADTNLKLFYGWSAAQTPIDLGANFPANTLSVDVYELRLWSPANAANWEIYWEVERLNTGHIARWVLNGTIGTTRPANNLLLTPFQSMRTNNATALAVGLDIFLVYTQTNFF